MVVISYGMLLLRDVKNYGRQLNLGVKVKIKRFNVKNKQDFNRITADCACQIVARATQTQWYKFHFELKIWRNRRHFCCKLLPIAHDKRTDTFSIWTIINIDLL